MLRGVGVIGIVVFGGLSGLRIALAGYEFLPLHNL